MRKPNDLLGRLLALVEQGVKTPGSALLYAAEYDRVHGTDLAAELQNALTLPSLPAREEQRARAKPRKRKVVPDASLDNPTD